MNICIISSSTLCAGVQHQLALLRMATWVIYDIFFSFNSATLRPESDETLSLIADLLNKYPDWKLAIGGHTDSIASDSFNLDLSNRRAVAVKTALVERFKIADNRLSTQGYGEASPRDTNNTLEGRARNRRVELVRQ